MPTLVALFILLPALELLLLLQVGAALGVGATFGLIVLTGVVGAALVRRQGLGVLRRIQDETAQGRLPAREMLEGLGLLVAGALLVTPGVLTDVVGFLALVPPLRARLARWAADHVVAQAVVVTTGPGPTASPGAPFSGPLGPTHPRPGDDRGPTGPSSDRPRPQRPDIVDVQGRSVD